MGERLGLHVSACLLLQVVVANLLCTVDGLLDIACLERAVGGILIVAPYAGIVIGQQLQTYADLVGLHLVHLAHLLVCLVECAQEVLHVVTHLVGDDVGIGEVTVGSQLRLHLGEEREVDVQLLVARAIERAHRCAGLSAGTVDAAREEHQRGGIIRLAHLLEDLGPDVLGGCQYLAREGGQFLLLLGEFALSLHLFFLYGAEAALLDYVGHYVADATSLHEGHHGYKNNTGQSAYSGFGPCAHSAAIFHVRAFSSSFKVHNMMICLFAI